MLSQNYVIPASDREEPCEYALQMVSQNSIKQEYQSNQSWMQSRWHSALIWNYWLYLKSNIVQTSQFSQISSQTLHIQYKIQICTPHTRELHLCKNSSSTTPRHSYLLVARKAVEEGGFSYQIIPYLQVIAQDNTYLVKTNSQSAILAGGYLTPDAPQLTRLSEFQAANQSLCQRSKLNLR
uniref:Uncharacterized protein n=1 Tax=Spironucleus salmonicida TaxID=348837 RepID=V6M4U1_9EUKA|eukprot:EST48374.1 Hypothetical protein SS50377_11448 [Spironucleus salmonicida]